nr:6755_t:CDS:2 [Entrophospora candida]
MCSIFVANCFIKHVTSTEGTISGTALYRNDNVFREISFKGYYDKANNVLNFSKHSIVVLVGRYVMEEGIEYVTLNQTIMVDKDGEGEEDLPHQDPLIIFTGVANNDFFVENETGGNFVLNRKLYNPMSKNKNINSEIYVTYVDENKRYKTIKNNLGRSIISVLGKLRISKTNKQHLAAKEIEWNLIPNEPKMNKDNNKNHDDEEKELELIEKSFEKVNKKRKHVAPSTSSSTSPTTSSTYSTTISVPTSSSPVTSTATDTTNAKDKEKAYDNMSKDILDE